MSRKASPLAPGFRFHPTDEELILYYLKRKLLSRPLPLHAIPEIDLYKFDPWDLPEKSPIPGDGEDPQWYFFSQLDRKHAGKAARANRATGRGYWKMTGRDRAVSGGTVGRVVGMKKTLVFHLGRAPKGQRTAWVMHEYRMADGELQKEGVDQDAYVVCRIFKKKSDREHQDGGKYGSSLQADNGNVLALHVEDTNGDPEDEQVRQLDEHEQKSQCLKIPDENAACLVTHDDGRSIFRCNDPANVLGEASDGPVLNETDRDFHMPDCNYGLDLRRKDNDPSVSDGYLELDNLAVPLEIEYPAENPAFLFDGPSIDMHQTSHDVDEFFNAGEDTTIKEDEFLKDILNTGAGESVSGEPDEPDDDEIYFDAPTNIPMVEQDSFVKMPDFMASIVAGHSAPDPMEELVAYFDAMESDLESPKFEDVVDNSVQKHSDEDAKDEAGTSSTETPLSANRDRVDAADPSCEERKEDISRGHLAKMLGSISRPPAFAAAEMSRTLGHKGSSPQASSSIHVTAGMVTVVDSCIVDGSGILWSSQKTQGISFLLPYDMARVDVRDHLLISEKMDAGWLLWVSRSGFGLCCFSVLFLALINKVGIFVYSR